MYSNSAVDRCLLLFLSQRKERESNPQGPSCKLGRLPTGSRRHSVCPSIIFQTSSSTRNRTWNFSLEARGDIRFTIEPCRLRQSVEPTERKAWELNPHNFYVALFSKQARLTVSGYLPNQDSANYGFHIPECNCFAGNYLHQISFAIAHGMCKRHLH